MKIVIMILIVLTIIYLVNNFKNNSIIEGNQNIDPELSYYKDKFQNLVNKLKQDKEFITNQEKKYNAMENIYKCLEYRYKFINKILEKERSGRSNQTSNAGDNLDTITDQVTDLP